MKNFPVFIFIAGALSLIVPTTGRLAYGIIIILGLLFLTFFTSLFRAICSKLQIDEYAIPLTLLCVSVVTVLYKLLISLYSPIIAFTMDFSFYLIALSSFLLGFLFTEYPENLSLFLYKNMKYSFIFSIFAFFFFLFREYIGYGTISFPIREGLFVLTISSFHILEPSFFWSSIPFAVLLLTLFLAFFTLAKGKFDIIRRKYY